MLICTKCRREITDTYLVANTIGGGYTGRVGKVTEYYHVGHGTGKVGITSRVIQQIDDMSQGDSYIPNKYRIKCKHAGSRKGWHTKKEKKL